MSVVAEQRAGALVVVGFAAAFILNGCTGSTSWIAGARPEALAQWDRAMAPSPAELPLIRAAIVQSPQPEQAVGVEFSQAEFADRRYDLSYLQEQGMIITDVLVRSARTLPRCSSSGPPVGTAEICRDTGRDDLAWVRKRASGSTLLQATISIPSAPVSTMTVGPFGRRDVGVIVHFVTSSK